jgi:hypothetical protein
MTRMFLEGTEGCREHRKETTAKNGNKSGMGKQRRREVQKPMKKPKRDCRIFGECERLYLQSDKQAIDTFGQGITHKL